MRKPEGEIGLGRRLANRWYPISLIIGFLVSVIPPASYYILESIALRRTAAIYAQTVSGKFPEFIFETPSLWKYQAHEYSLMIRDFLPYKDVTIIRILDELGRSIADNEHVTVKAEAWWNRFASVESAPIFFNNRKIGTIQVGISQGALLKVTFTLLILSTTIGVGLAVLGYLFPVRVVTKMERQIQELIETVRQSNAELEEMVAEQRSLAVENTGLFEESQRNLERIRALQEIDHAITSTLDLGAVLKFLLEKIDLLLTYSASTVRLFNKESGLLEPVACRNLDEEEWKAEKWRGGRGIPNVVFETKSPWMVSNVQTDPHVRDPEFFRKHGLVSYLGVPLIGKGEILGVLSFYTKEEHKFSKEEVEFLSTLAGQAAIAIHNSRLHEETEHRRREAEELARVAQSLTETLDMAAVGERIVTSVRELFGVRASMLRLLQPDGSLRAIASSGEGFSQDSGVDVLPVSTGLVGRAVAEGRPIWSADVLNDPRIRFTDQMRDYLVRSGNRSMIAAPLRAHEKIIGSLGSLDQTGRVYSDSEVALVQTFADQAALALENARLYEEVRKKVQELQQKAADLERASKGKSEFLSVMSHELMTPLHAVMAFTGMIQKGMFGHINQEQEQILSKVLTHSKDLLTTLRDILEATRIEAEAVKVESEEVHVGDFLGQLRSLYDVPLDKGLTLNWDYCCEALSMRTDREKLRHILQNLINNAIKFTERGSVTISARHIPEAKAVEFKVADTGIGISEEALPIVFDMFRQVDSSETRSYGGVGLGLYIVKKFTDLLGGKIDVESEPGKGSTFTVTIPEIQK